MLTDGRIDGRTHARTDDGRKVITIAHPEQSSGELKMYLKFTDVLPVRTKCLADMSGGHTDLA